MEITDFLTQSFLTTYSGTLIAIELLVFVTKNLPLIKKIPTRVFTFVLAIAHSVVINVINGTFESSLKFYYLLFINSIVITVTLCGGYDVVVGKINLSLNRNTSGSGSDSDSDTKATSDITSENTVENDSLNNYAPSTIFTNNMKMPESTVEEPKDKGDVKTVAAITKEETTKDDNISDFAPEDYQVKEKNNDEIKEKNNDEIKEKNNDEIDSTIFKGKKKESLNVKGGLDINNFFKNLK